MCSSFPSFRIVSINWILEHKLVICSFSPKKGNKLTLLLVFSMILSVLPARDAFTKLSNSSVHMLLLFVMKSSTQVNYIRFKHILLPYFLILCISLGKYSKILHLGSKYLRKSSSPNPGNIGTYAFLIWSLVRNY